MDPRGKSKSTRAGGAEQSVDTEETLYDVLHHSARRWPLLRRSQERCTQRKTTERPGLPDPRL